MFAYRSFLSPKAYRNILYISKKFSVFNVGIIYNKCEQKEAKVTVAFNS